MNKIKNLIIDLVLYVKKFGFCGLLLWFKRVFFRHHTITFRSLKYKYNIYLRNNSSDIPVFKQILVNEDYNIDLNFEPKWIIDCGANIGLSALYFKKKYPKSKIVAVEPEKNNFKLLKLNLENHIDITCINAAIWYKNTYLKIIDKKIGNYAFMIEESDNSDDSDIIATSIGEIVDKFCIDSIDILKIDIEGSEKEVFSNNIEKWLPITKVLIIELHDHFREGASDSFFKAIANFNYTTTQNGENLICYFRK